MYKHLQQILAINSVFVTWTLYKRTCNRIENKFVFNISCD